MFEITRRSLMATGAIFATPVVAKLRPLSIDTPSTDRKAPPFPASALAPREHLLFDFNWRFAFGHGSDPARDFGFGQGQADFAKTGDFKLAKSDFDDSGWRSLDLPHDWAVELPFVHDETGEGDSRSRSHGFKPLGRRYPDTSIGWYRRAFEIPKRDLGRRIWVEFDGALRDVQIFVNGCFIGRNDNGYAPFRFDLTDFLAYGERNYLVVRVDASFGDGWFYEGAGLYRHVWLTKTDPVHLAKWESVVRCKVTTDGAALELVTVIENEGAAAVEAKIDWTIFDAGGVKVGSASTAAAPLAPGASGAVRTTTMLAAPALWSPDTPHLYTAEARVVVDGQVRDGERVEFGVRDARFDAQHGFLLNGKPVKLQGTCNHHDHAGVGAAVPDQLQWFRLSVLRDMGCNAVRTTHNMPTPEWVAACDRMGMMMMCETRQMSANPEAMAQLEVMLKRYRNSPSIILWSIGNEEWLLQQGKLAPQGARIARTMVRRCHDLDPTRPVTAAVNGDNEQGVSEALDVIGFNYHSEMPDGFHQKHPAIAVVGSETSSAISTRGEYATDPRRNVVSSYDGVVGWGQTPEQWWQFYGTREWLAGGFAWTGFDYRGEPTPYGWPSVSSQFGIVDLCGFPKDYFHYYRAWWRPEPVLHLFPHWDWPDRTGGTVSVWVYSNLDEVELLLNGKSLGRKPVPRLGHVEWQVGYEPGAIEARGMRQGRVIRTQRRETTSDPRAIRLSADQQVIDANRVDVAVVTVEVIDGKGRPVPRANQKVAFKVSGPGRIIGVGNGDPNCLESDKGESRSLFNGLAQVIVQSDGGMGPITVEAASANPAFGVLAPARLVISTQRAPLRSFVP